MIGTTSLVSSTKEILNGNGKVDYLPPTYSEEASSTKDADVVDASEVQCEPSTSSVEHFKVNQPEMTYDSQFPALPEVKKSSELSTDSPWNRSHNVSNKNNIMKVRSNRISEVYVVDATERKAREGIFGNAHSGSTAFETKVCTDIANKTNTSIEIYSPGNGSLNFLIYGREDSVQDAKKRIADELQTPANFALQVPKEHHRFILGRGGKNLQNLEQRTNTKITVPKSESSAGEPIIIKGAKENIENAVHEIQLISAEASSKYKEEVFVEREYHAFINGPFNETIAELQAETGAKINVPPSSVNKNDIVITGEQSAVQKAKKMILAIYEEKKATCTTFSMVIKKEQHKYIVGPKGAALNEFFKNTGVSIEMPLDSNSEQIILRGEQGKMSSALALLYEKAHYVVKESMPCASWMQKHLLGKKGMHLNTLQPKFPNVQVTFSVLDNEIVMHGPRNEVAVAKQVFTDEIAKFSEQFKMRELNVEQRFHRYIIGKAGVNINNIRQQTGAEIKIPSESTNEQVVRIEGSEEAINAAYDLLQEILKKASEREAEITKDVIIEQRFHRAIIGTKGESIREIREKFNVQIEVPESRVKSDRVLVRGEQNAVDACIKHLTQLHQKMQTENHLLELPIIKAFHKYIIGKDGAKLRKIRLDTQTKIMFPNEDSTSNVITITGTKGNVERAKELIQEIEKEEMNLVQVDIIIPHRFHNLIIGKNGALIRSISEECDNVTFTFPPENSQSDKVTLRGTKEGVQKAKKHLTELSNDKQLNGYQEVLPCKHEYHQFIIGKAGANINQVREKYQVRVLMPSENDVGEGRDQIVIVGRKEKVAAAKKALQEKITSLDNTVEITMQIPQKYHAYFISRRNNLLRKLAEDYNNVRVRFPPKGATENSDTVVLTGGKDFVEGAKKRLQDIVDNLDNQVTHTLTIDNKFHRYVMGPRCCNLNHLENKYDVQIKFSRKPEENAENEQRSDEISIIGHKDIVEKVAADLLELVPIVEEMEVPREFHRNIIGQKGVFLHGLREQFHVEVKIPLPADNSDTITIQGEKNNVEKAKAAINERLNSLLEDKADREARNYTQELIVPHEYHRKLIGPKGATIMEIRKIFSVNINFPDKAKNGDAHVTPVAVAGNEENGENVENGDTETPAEVPRDTAADTLTFVGYEKNVKSAIRRINKMVKELQSQTTIELQIDPEFHSKLIGRQGKNVRKIMDDYKVNIKFPSDGGKLVSISGAAKNAEACRDYILTQVDNVEEDWTEQYRPPKSFTLSHFEVRSGHGRRFNEKAPEPEPQQQGFFVRDAPWAKGSEDFPSMDTGSSESNGLKGAWGNRSHA